MDTKALQNDQKHLKVVKSARKATQQSAKGPKGKPKGPQRRPKSAKGGPKTFQKAIKRHLKATPEPNKRINRHRTSGIYLFISETCLKHHACAVFRASLKY